MRREEGYGTSAPKGGSRPRVDGAGRGTGMEPEDRILFILNGMVVTGSTRLQKYGFLLAQQHDEELTRLLSVHGGPGFYRDWVPYHFGPYSRDLKNDVDAGIRNGIIRDAYSNNATTYTLTMNGRFKWRRLLAKSGDDMEKIAQKIKSLQGIQLYDLLRYTYSRYPDYTIRSKIANSL